MGHKRNYDVGEHSKYISVEHSAGTCPLEDAVKTTKDDELFELINESDRGDVICFWAAQMPWKPDHAMASKCMHEGAVTIDSTASTSDSVLHLQQCIQYHNCVDNLMQHYIGRFLSKLVEMTPSKTQNQLLSDLCNFAEGQKVDYYLQSLHHCQCRECLLAQEWELGDHSVASTRPFPCRATQVLCKLAYKRFVNLTPAFLKQCITQARKLSVHSCLTDAPMSSFSLKQIVSKYSSIGDYSQLLTLSAPVFKCQSGMAIEGVQYVDGDGGIIVAELFPGLMECVDKYSVPFTKDDLQGHTLVQFRERFHDAPELGHKYTIKIIRENQEHPEIMQREYGYDALVQSRVRVEQCAEIFVAVHGVDFRGQRLLVDILTVPQGTLPVVHHSNVTNLVAHGLTYPVKDSPIGLSQSESAKKNMGAFGEVLYDDRLAPWSLKRTMAQAQETIVEIEDENKCYEIKIENCMTRLNEAHLMVGKSIIPNAGRGLFIKPRPFAATHPIIIPKGRRLCYYSRYSLTRAEVEALETHDYFITVGQKCFDASTYTGDNMGRFINQGGLFEGLKVMCRESAKKDQSMHHNVIREAVSQYTNVKFMYSQMKLDIVASKDLQLSSQSQELFIDYDIFQYWVPYVLHNLDAFGYDSELSTYVLWCVLSKESNWSTKMRTDMLEGLSIPSDVKDRYRVMPCPVSLELPARSARGQHPQSSTSVPMAKRRKT